MRSFGFQIWLERRSSRFSVFYFGAEVKFGASVDVGRAFPRFRPVDPPTNDTRRYEATVLCQNKGYGFTLKQNLQKSSLEHDTCIERCQMI